MVDRSVGFGGEEKAMGRRRRGEPVGEDVGTARGFSMVQVKFHGSSCSWRCVWRVKGIRTPPSSSSNSFFERFFPEPPPPPPVLPPRGRSSPPEPLPPRGKASSASSSSLVRLAPIARDQRACAMLECVATWPRLWLQRATAVGDLSPTAYWSAPAPSSCPFLGLWVPFRPNRRSLPA